LKQEPVVLFSFIGGNSSEVW